MYHGTHIETLTIVDGMDLCLCADRKIAESYAAAVGHLGQAHIHVLTLSLSARIAGESDIIAAAAEVYGKSEDSDPWDYADWISSTYVYEMVDDADVREALAVGGYHGCEYADLSPENDDTHTTVRVWAAAALEA